MSRREQLEKLLDASPGDAFLLYGLALEHANHGDPAAAVTWFDRCLEADPACLYAYFHKARALEALGRSAQAVEALRSGVERARAAGDAKALAELSAYLDELSP